MTPVLAADIGATNARFALVERPAGEARIVFERTYPTASFPDFEPALAAFLREAASRPARAAIAIAGPIEEEAGRLTNRAAWTVERRSLAAQGIDARLINDFQALAYGVAYAGPENWIVVQAGEAKPKAAMAAVGAGTGLGVASLFWDGQRYHACPSEGGHIGFAPRSDLELELFRYLLSRYGRVSAERVVSGAGLVAIYEFMRLRAALAEPLTDPATVSTRALAEPSSLAAKALDFFVHCYGTFAGDIALAFLARGGLYVSGGIAAKLAHRLAAGDFLTAFNDKGRHQGLAASIPVRVVTNEKLGLLGAARAAA